MAEQPTPQEVYRMFKRCRSQDKKSKRDELVTRLYETVSNPDYRDGEIAHIMAGGIRDDLFTGLPTGILRIPALHVLHWKYSEIDWSVFLENAELIQSKRFLYIASVLHNAFRRKSATPASFRANLLLLHLNSYLRIPLYSSGAVRGALASVNHSYGFPGTYAAEVFEDKEGQLRLSDCSLDIIREREKKNEIYNRGYLFRLSNLSCLFYFDRRANISFQNAFANYAVEDQQLTGYLPSEDKILQHEKKLNDALNVLHHAKLKVHEKLANYLKITAELSYSILGFCLFELLHEFLYDRYPKIHSVNRILQRLDPKQTQKWSMRGFSVESIERLATVLNQNIEDGEKGFRTAKPDPFEEFCYFFCDEALIRVEAFSNDWSKQSNFYDCAYNCEFFKSFYDLEKHGKVLDERSEIGRLNRVIGDAMGSHLLNLMAVSGIGPVCIPFQPDNRGEFLITPRINGWTGLEVDRVRLDLSTDPHNVIIEQPAIEASVVIESRSREHSPFYFGGYLAVDPRVTKQEYDSKFAALLPTLEAKADHLARWIGKKRIVAVVIPFFKEKRTFVDVAVESAQSIQKLGYHPLIILTSNQPTYQPLNGAGHVLPESVGMVENALFNSGIGRLWDHYFIAVIQTDVVNGIGHWMIEKFMNVHCGAKLITLLTNKKVDVVHAAFLEGDVENVGAWWGRIGKKISDLPDVLFLEFIVGVRGEDSDEIPTCDLHGSDALLARFICEPLTGAVLGTPLRSLFGGNYFLRPKAISDFVKNLDSSQHTESLIESWLPDLVSRHTVGAKNVGQKIHLPALERFFFSTDDKFIKWTMDLFAAISRFQTSDARLPKRNFRRVELAPISFATDQRDRVKERILNALRNFNYCQEIYNKVLSRTHKTTWHKIARSLGSSLDSSNSIVIKVTETLWTQTLVSFYQETRSATNQEEVVFALKVLFDFLIASFGSDRIVLIESWATRCARGK